jgi:SAM-dependent methyltransferase
MSDISERSFVQGQYQNPARLNARSALHARFSTNPYGWFAWVWDRLPLRFRMRVLEIGCGDARLWHGRAESVPAGCRLTLTDLSPGMLHRARQRLPIGWSQYAVADAQSLPFAEASYDLVIANHVLYHVPDRPRALAEIHRVLVPGGQLCATTIGERHMAELLGWMAEVVPDTPIWGGGTAQAFTLQSAPAELAPFFARVRCEHYPDALAVTEIEPLLAYALSMDTDGALVARQDALVARQDALRALFQREMQAHGVVRITKESGMLTAHKPPA